MGQAITLTQFRQALSDPNYATAYMIANNPEAIADNLREMGFIVSDPEGITNAVNALLAAGEQQKFKDAFSVPVRMDRISPDELNVLTQTSAAMVRSAGGSAKEFDINALFGGLATGTLFYLNQQGANAVNPTAPGNTAPPAPAKDNTTMYVVGGIAIVVLVIILFAVFRKKGIKA